MIIAFLTSPWFSFNRNNRESFHQPCTLAWWLADACGRCGFESIQDEVSWEPRCLTCWTRTLLTDLLGHRLKPPPSVTNYLPLETHFTSTPEVRSGTANDKWTQAFRKGSCLNVCTQMILIWLHNFHFQHLQTVCYPALCAISIWLLSICRLCSGQPGAQLHTHTLKHESQNCGLGRARKWGSSHILTQELSD